MRNANFNPIHADGRSLTRPCAIGAAVIALLAVFAFAVASCSLPQGEDAPSAEAQTAVDYSTDHESQSAADSETTEESDESADGVLAGASNDEGSELGVAQTSPTAVVDWAENVEEFLQYPVLQGGCEVASLSCVLRSMGYDEVDEYTIADDYLEYGDMVDGYSGDPYFYGSCFPPPLMDAANAFLEDKGASERAVDLTSLSFDDLSEWVEAGYPVLVWSTMYMDEPELTGAMVGRYEWWDNEHCVVVYGFDEAGDVLVMDPIEGLITRDRDDFARIYEECGSLSCVIC